MAMRFMAWNALKTGSGAMHSIQENLDLSGERPFLSTSRSLVDERTTDKDPGQLTNNLHQYFFFFFFCQHCHMPTLFKIAPN